VKKGLPPIEEPTAPPVVSSGLTFAQVAQEYLDHAIDESIDDDDPFRLKLSSRNSNRDLLNVYWLPSLGKRQIDSITADDLKAAIKGVKWKSKRKQNAIGAMRQVFAWAEHEDESKERYIATNPMHQFAATSKKKRRPRKKPAPDAYTPENRDKLLSRLKSHAPIGTYVFYLVAFYSGMRTGELLALTWDDYDGESLRVEKARVRSQITSTKTEEERKVLMPAWAASSTPYPRDSSDARFSSTDMVSRTCAPRT
jgi:integrase